MSGLDIRLDASDLAKQFGERFGQLGKKMPTAIRLAINRTGDTALSQVRRALPGQTGLKFGTIKRAVKPTKASAGSLTYSIKSKGGNVRLKYFGARETSRGVSAAPWNARRVYAGTFMRAGWWPKRVTKANWNGQVFRRAGGTTRNGKPRFAVVRSDLFIPDEMVTGASAAAFHGAVQTVLPRRLEHELSRLLGG